MKRLLLQVYQLFRTKERNSSGGLSTKLPDLFYLIFSWNLFASGGQLFSENRPYQATTILVMFPETSYRNGYWYTLCTEEPDYLYIPASVCRREKLRWPPKLLSLWNHREKTWNSRLHEQRGIKRGGVPVIWRWASGFQSHFCRNLWPPVTDEACDLTPSGHHPPISCSLLTTKHWTKQWTKHHYFGRLPLFTFLGVTFFMSAQF